MLGAVTKRSLLGVAASFQMFYMALFMAFGNIIIPSPVVYVIYATFACFVLTKLIGMRKDLNEAFQSMEDGGPVPEPDVKRYIVKTIWNKRWFGEKHGSHD